jgi:hypothetical protein
MKIPKFEISFVIAGYFAGLLPAALTSDANPHALRSFGAVVFLVLGVGGGLSLLWNFSLSARFAVIGTSIAFLIAFANVYFFDYPSIARPWFATTFDDLAKQLTSENRVLEMNDVLKAHNTSYAPMAISYYQLASGATRCPVRTPPRNL